MSVRVGSCARPILAPRWRSLVCAIIFDVIPLIGIGSNCGGGGVSGLKVLDGPAVEVEALGPLNDPGIPSSGHGGTYVVKTHGLANQMRRGGRLARHSDVIPPNPSCAFALIAAL